MNDFSIRITRREGDTEHVVEIGAQVPGKDDRHSEAMARWERAMARADTPTLEWSGTLCNGERVNHATAEKACAALGEGWRLPTRMELESILDLTRHDPAIDTERFPDTQSGAYWTSTPCAWAPSCAWVVYFDYGYAHDSRRDYNFAFVRAVRAVPAGQ